MFVLHPSSRCDVCLEGFSSELEMAPYAIPCGHVFCKTCLESVVPPKCPMCRKNFDPARLKKLHVDRPEGVEDPKEGDLLQRLAMSFDAPEEHRQDLLTEVDRWLGEKHAEGAQPLRKARIAIEKYQELREMGIQGKREIAVLKQEMRDKVTVMDVEKERATAIETNLLDRARELQAQVAAAQGEIEHLRAEVHRRSQLKNPLPPPPQPISFDRYGSFRPSTAGSSHSWYNDNGRSMLPPSRGPVLNGGSYIHTNNTLIEDERENEIHVPYESNGVKRDRKGKGRGAPDPLADVHRPIYGPPPPIYQAPLDAPKPKPGIIPGASPKSKFMPPDPETEVRERGFNAFKPPDPPILPSSHFEAPSKWFDPARDAVDPWSLIASALPQYANGFTEGYTNGLQTVQHMASGSRARDSDGEVAASESDKEKQERRARRRKEKEMERRRRAEREQLGPNRERQSRREREGQRPTDSLPELASSSTSTTSVRPRRGEDLRASRSHNHRPQSIDIVGQQNEPSPSVVKNPSPSRRRSTSRPRTGGPIPPQPVIPPQPAPQPPNPVAQHIAQPTPRVPVHIEELDYSAAEVIQASPASRRSIQSNSTTDSWGTVSSLSENSPNSFSSLNLRSFSRQPAIPFDPQPYSSPTIPPGPQPAPPEEESTDDDTETERVSPNINASTRESWEHRVRRREEERGYASNRNSNEVHRQPPHSAPVSAPAHGSRHTQALLVPDHYQNPTLPYQRSANTTQSANAIAIPEPNARQTRNNRNRQEGHQPRTRNSASQVPSAAVIPNNGGALDARTRRVSFTSVPTVNASISSLSLQSTASRVGPQITNESPENDIGYHTDVPYSGNALGLAISAVDREYTTRNRATGGPPITAPTPIVSNLSFLRSFSYDNYAP